MATPTNPSVKTTKSGISLETFETVKLYKKVPEVPPVADVTEALSRVGNDEKKLLSIIQEGLQAEAVRNARDTESGWLQIDDDGKETTNEFSGNLVTPEILNPLVLNLARINQTTVKRDGKEVEITWDECQSPEEKRAVKEATIEMIKSTPKILAGLKMKMAASVKAGE